MKLIELAKIQVYMSNKTQNSNNFSLLRKSGSHKNMLNFKAIVYMSLQKILKLLQTRYIFKKSGSHKMEVILLTIPGQCFCVICFTFCLDVTCSIVVTCRVRVDLSALL